MNVKRFIGATAAFFAFLYLYHWLIHGILLQNIYHESPTLWRPMEQMNSMMPLCIFFRLAVAGWITFMFAKFYRDGGTENGLRFGFYIGVFAGIMAASTFMWLPISAKLAWAWFIGNVVEYLAGGAIIGAIYRK